MVSNNIKILLAEDDEIARVNAAEYLQNFCQSVISAKDGLEAYQLYKEQNPDIVITDIQMPKLNGLDLAKKIRERDKACQIIILTAYSDTSYLLQAVELGLVKYLIKPVDEKSLENALQICFDAINSKSSNIIALHKDCNYDSYNLTISVNGQISQLRTKEALLLNLLIKNNNRFVTYSEIENSLWQDAPMTMDALKTVVKNLKAKICKNIITNLSGTGYKIDIQ